MNAFITIIIFVSIIFLQFDLVFMTGYENQFDINVCINIIYQDYSIPRPSTNIDRRTNDLPQKMLSSIRFRNLISKDAQEYFMYVHDILSPIVVPIEENAETLEMMNPVQFCEVMTKDNLEKEIDLPECRVQLSNFFRHSLDPWYILQKAFKNLLAEYIPREKRYAYDYYLHIDSIISATVKNGLVMKPEEWCELSPEKKYMGRKRPLDSAESSSFESKKYGGGRGSSSTHQQA